jgi:SAM-dependent methyltransferase
MAFPGAKRLKALLLRPEISYRAYLKHKFGASSLSERPPQEIRVLNGTLKNRAAWEQALEAVKRLHLPQHRDGPKHWDHLAAISAILENTSSTANILDAGAELYSNVLPSLFLYGYRNLYGINLDFRFPMRRGPIRYLPGDLTRTPFADSFFDAATCLSVIEHGVPLEEYFREMHRVLRPNGLLITSTDYYPTPIDTGGQSAYGVPIKVFSKPEIEGALELARNVGLEPTGVIDLDCVEKPITWDDYGLHYTFVLFNLRKVKP